MFLPQSRKKLGLFLISILFLLSFLVYLPTVFNGFLYDDMEQVLGNPWIVDFTHLGEIFLSPSWAFMTETVGSNYYRPMMHLGFLVEHHLFGFSPIAFHLVNVILHSLNSVLLFSVVCLLFRNNGARSLVPDSTERAAAQGASTLSYIYWAFAAAMIFALHPINSEVVNWVSALPELSYTLFLLAAFYIYILLDRTTCLKARALLYSLSVIFFFFALLSKETAMAFLLFIFCYDFLTFGASFIKRYRRYIPYIVIAIIYMILRTYVLGGLAQKKMVTLSAYHSVLNIFPAAVRYIGKLIWPSNLSIIYSYEPYYSLFQATVIFSIILLLLIIISLVLLRKRENLLFAALWVVIPLLPVLYIPVVSIGGFADRYLYLPSAGFAILAVVIFRSLCVKIERPKLIMLLFISLFIIYSVFTIKRSMVWRSSMTLWSDTLRHAPDSVIVNLGLAAAYRSRGDNELAIEYYRRVVRLEPFNYKPYYNLALIYQDLGDKAKATVNYQSTIRLNPFNYKAYFNLAVLYEQSGEVEKAAYFYKETIRLNPRDGLARANLGRLYKNTNNPAAALALYKEAVRVVPLSATAHYNLAWSFQEAGDNRSAINSFKEAIRLDPRSSGALYGLAWIYHFTGEFALAERFYKETIKVGPGLADAYFNLGLIYSDRGDFKAAVKSFKMVLKINPDYREAKSRLNRAKALALSEK